MCSRLWSNELLESKRLQQHQSKSNQEGGHVGAVCGLQVQAYLPCQELDLLVHGVFHNDGAIGGERECKREGVHRVVHARNQHQLACRVRRFRRLDAEHEFKIRQGKAGIEGWCESRDGEYVLRQNYRTQESQDPEERCWQESSAPLAESSERRREVEVQEITGSVFGHLPHAVSVEEGVKSGVAEVCKEEEIKERSGRKRVERRFRSYLSSLAET